MSYKQALLQSRELADRIASGEYSQEKKVERQEKTQGLVARPSRDMPELRSEEAPDNQEAQIMMASYVASFRRKNEAPAVEEGIDTQTVTTAPRPRSREQGGFNAPVKGLMTNAFQESLGLDKDTASILSKAFLINFQDESGMIADRVEMEPNVHGTRGKGYYQLTGDRRTKFESIYGPDGYTDQNQTDFLVKELMGSESRAAKEILSAARSGNVGETAATIVDKFLRPAKEHRLERMSRYREDYGQ